MASTSVHLPARLVAALDRIAERRGTSRNRVILQACQDLVDAQPGAWPPGFFDSPYTPDDEALLREAGEELERDVLAARRDRPVPPL